MNDEPSESSVPQSSLPVLADEVAEMEDRDSSSLQEKKQRARKKRLEYLDDMLRNFDILIYAELSAVYYLEYDHDAI